MEKNDILDVASTWSFWDRELPTSIPRVIDLPKSLAPSRCLVVQGVRRCGKSTLLQQMIKRYDLDPKHCAFLNLEDPRLSNRLSYPLLDHLVEEFRKQHGKKTQLSFFLDEIQAVDGWERWLRTQLDSKKNNLFFITGSNATLLSGELSTALTGRHLTVHLFPFSLEEVRLKYKKTTLKRYLHDGGFPEPLSTPDGDSLRRQYFHDIIERDIRERVRARSSQPIRQVVQMVFEAAGSEMSLRRIAGATGIAIETTRSYLEASEAAYLLFGVPYFAFSARKRAQRNIKYYPVDTGLRRVVITKTGDDLSKNLECAVYRALRQNYDEIFYWRGKNEVDFVVRHEGKITPYQITWKEPQKRHQKALMEFYEHFPQAEEAVFVTSENFNTLFT